MTEKRGTKNARSWINSFKIDKCDVMWWTSDPRQSLIILCLGKCLSYSFQSLKMKTTRHYPNDILKNWLSYRWCWTQAPWMDITKWGITQQSVVRINWNFETRRQNRFSHNSLIILVLGLIFLVPALYCRISISGLGPTIFNRQAKFCHCQLHIILNFQYTKFYLILTRTCWAIAHWLIHSSQMSTTWRHRFYQFWLNFTQTSVPFFSHFSHL